MATKKCIYCGTTLTAANRSKEHVLRESWLKRLGHFKSPVLLSQWSRGKRLSDRAMAAGALQAGDVGKCCNNGWMDKLDLEAEKPFFALLEGTAGPDTWSWETRLLMGRWVLKMSCSFKATDAPGRRHLSREVLKGVQQDGYLPRGFIAFCTTFEPGDWDRVAVGHMDMWLHPLPTAFAGMPQTARLKFAMKYDSLVIGCAFIDHPEVEFVTPAGLLNVFVGKDCVLREDPFLNEQVRQGLHVSDLGPTPVNWVLLGINAGLRTQP